MSDDKLDSGIILQQLLLDSDSAVEEDFALLGQTAALDVAKYCSHDFETRSARLFPEIQLLKQGLESV